MSTTYEHTQLSAVQEDGNVKVLYPVNTAKDVSIETTNTAIPSSVKTAQDLVDKIDEMAFKNGSDVVFLGESEEFPGSSVESEINDDTVSSVTTWSSSNIVKNTTKFIQGYKMSTDIINKLFSSVVVFNVDGRFTANDEFTPEAGRQWVVEYFPIVTSANNVDGNVSDISTVTTAYQRWTGINYNNTPEVSSLVVYERVLINGTWSEFTKVR